MNWMADDFFLLLMIYKGNFFCDTYMIRKERIFLLKNVRNRSQYSVGQYAMTWALIEKAAKPKEMRPKEIKKE